MFSVFIQYESRVEARKTFRDPVKAQEYFEELRRRRTRREAAVVGQQGTALKKYFRIDEDWWGERQLLDKGWQDNCLRTGR